VDPIFFASHSMSTGSVVDLNVRVFEFGLCVWFL